MGKKEELIKRIKTIINDADKLERFIIENSNLPGPRGNLELAYAFAEIYENMDILSKWLKITEDQADVNNPRSFLAFCSAVSLGKIYTKNNDRMIIETLKVLANDGRWRMREAVAFGFQIIGEYDFSLLKIIFSEWIKKSNNTGKRAILVSLAHPKFLDKEKAEFCFDILDKVLNDMDINSNFEILKKGLGFTISVFAASNPELGFSLIKKWIGKNKIIDRIMKENLKKNRLIKKYPEEVNILLNDLS